MVSIIEKAGASGLIAGTWASGCERPGSRRADAEAAASALPLTWRFAAGAGVRPRSRRTDPEAATNGLALAERFVLEAGLRIFLLDLRAIVFPLLGFVPLPIPEAHIGQREGGNPVPPGAEMKDAANALPCQRVRLAEVTTGPRPEIAHRIPDTQRRQRRLWVPDIALPSGQARGRARHSGMTGAGLAQFNKRGDSPCPRMARGGAYPRSLRAVADFARRCLRRDVDGPIHQSHVAAAGAWKESGWLEIQEA